jgi:hypothetical protein
MPSPESRALKLTRQGRAGKRSPQLTPGPLTVTPGGSLVAVVMVVAFGARRSGASAERAWRARKGSARHRSRGKTGS